MFNTMITAGTVITGFLGYCLAPLGKEIGENLATVYRSKIGDNVIRWSQKTEAILQEKNISPEQVQKAMENTDTSTKVLEVLDRVKNKTDEYIQQLFAQIMASEIEQEGSYSLNTINRLSLMTRKDLEYFYDKVAPFCFAPLGYFNTTDKTDTNIRLIELNVTIYGRNPKFRRFESNHEILLKEIFLKNNFYNREEFYIQGNNVVKLENKLTALSPFGKDLCNLGKAENKIRKWTEEDKKEILQVMKTCGIEEQDVKFG